MSAQSEAIQADLVRTTLDPMGSRCSVGAALAAFLLALLAAVFVLVLVVGGFAGWSLAGCCCGAARLLLW